MYFHNAYSVKKNNLELYILLKRRILYCGYNHELQGFNYKCYVFRIVMSSYYRKGIVYCNL